MKIKRSTVAGEVPTIGPSSDHTDGTWTALNIYPGELFENIPDKRLWMGVDGGVQELGVITRIAASLSSAEMLALNTTPIQAIGAPGAGLYTCIHKAIGSLTAGAAAYAGNQIELTYPTGNIQAAQWLAAFTTSAVDRKGEVATTNEAIIIPENDPVNLFVPAADPTLGNGTYEFQVYYSTNLFT